MGIITHMAKLHKGTHTAIRRRFRCFSGNRHDNLPISAKVGGRDRLAEFFAERGFNIGAEIGVKQGGYSKILCTSNPKLKLYCIDIWEDEGRYAERHSRYLRQAIRNLKPFNAEIIHKASMDALPDFADGSLDFVYIDAAHDFDNVAMDIICWSRKVHSGGIVACHDYYHFRNAGVVDAVNGYTRCHDIRPWYVTRELLPTAFWVKP